MAKVKIVESSSEFLSVIEKSGLLNSTELETARKICGATDDPKAAARKLLSEGLVTHWQATQLLAGFSGLVLGKYELMDVVAKGDLGRVYLAEHVTLGQKVLLQTLSTKSITDPKLVERFLNDARTASSFEHPNTVRVLDITSEQDRHFIVTDYVVGTDLQQRVEKEGPLAPDIAVELVAQAVEGLDYIHSKGVLHRDLKPSNLLVDGKGAIRIQEVGLGHLRHIEQSGNESSGQISLTSLGFISPEQARAKEVDARTDVYALGGILYFLITGRVPFTATNDDEREVIKQTKRPVPICTLKPEIPADLAKLADQMMALRAADRPASMAEVIRKLRASLAVPADSAVETVIAEEKEPGSDTVGESDTATVEDESAAIAAALSERDESADDSVASIALKTRVPASAEKAAAAPTGFKIQKKRRGANQSNAESPGGEVSASALVLAKKRRARLIMLVGSISAVIIVVVVAIIASMFSPNDEPELAKQENPAASDQAGAATPTGPEAQASPELPDTAPATAPAAATAGEAAATAAPSNTATPATTPGVGTVAAPAAGQTPPPAAPASTSTAGTTPASTAPAGAPAGAAVNPPATALTAPSGAPADTSASTPALPAKSQPAAPATLAPTASPPATPTPETKPSTPATPPATAEKKDEEKKKTEPKPEPAKPATSAKTFEIAAAVDLPRLPAADGTAAAESPGKVLGKINIAENASCFISLYGGDAAVKGKTEFSLRSARGGTAPRDWEFMVKDAAAETMIATLALQANELKFEWTPDGLKNAVSPHLRNCALKINVGQDKPYTVALRTARVEPPASLATLEKSPVTVKFIVDALPNPTALRFEPKMGDTKVIFEAAGSADKGDQWIHFGENKDQAILSVKMEPSTNAKGVNILLTPYFSLPGDKPQRLTAALRKKISLAELQQQKNLALARADQLKKSAPKDQAGKFQNESQQTQVNQMIGNLDAAITKLQKLEELLGKFNSAQLHMRVYYDAHEAQVDLVRTDVNAPPGS